MESDSKTTIHTEEESVQHSLNEVKIPTDEEITNIDDDTFFDWVRQEFDQIPNNDTKEVIRILFMFGYKDRIALIRIFSGCTHQQVINDSVDHFGCKSIEAESAKQQWDGTIKTKIGDTLTDAPFPEDAYRPFGISHTEEHLAKVEREFRAIIRKTFYSEVS
ncbi:MAG: hypothetical protein KAS32_30810 [Candidatus Peribacteraceae bacterium]|nr:hypothetical protein [Candidatus Peribacteraceae bacterium]